MSINTQFIPNAEVTPLVESNIFYAKPEKRFALIAFGLGLRDNDELFTSYLKLRANVYIHQKGFLPNDALKSDGTESDQEDQRSSHFLVVENKLGTVAAVSCIRLIEKSKSAPTPLPIETFFPDVFEYEQPGLKTAEVSRFISRLDSARDQMMSISELFKSTLARINQEKLGPVYAIVEEDLETSLKYMGAPPTRLAEPHFVEKYNTYNVGVEIDTSSMIKRQGLDKISSIDVSDGAVRYWGKLKETDPTKDLQEIA